MDYKQISGETLRGRVSDTNNLELFRKKQNENKRKEEEKVNKEQNDNIPYYAYNCNFIF
jgi:hypothetical protein